MNPYLWTRQLFADSGWSLEDLLLAMNDRDGWRDSQGNTRCLRNIMIMDIYIYISCLNFWHEAWWFFISQGFWIIFFIFIVIFKSFSRYVLRPSSDVCRTREPTRNFEPHPLLNLWRGSKFHVGSRVRKTPEWGRMTYQQKHGDYSNKDEDNSLKTMIYIYI